MIQSSHSFSQCHGPDNAEHELRKAYNSTIDTRVIHYWDRKTLSEVTADEVETVYKRAYHFYKAGNLLAAERWARTAKHLARAFWHEAKIAFLEPHSKDLPFLEGAQNEEYGLRERSDSTEDLLNSVASIIPQGLRKTPEDMVHYALRGRQHLELLHKPGCTHELLRAERTNAAHEYGRVLECMALAYEAEASPPINNISSMR